jgi:hypothetical protein
LRLCLGGGGGGRSRFRRAGRGARGRRRRRRHRRGRRDRRLGLSDRRRHRRNGGLRLRLRWASPGQREIPDLLRPDGVRLLSLECGRRRGKQERAESSVCRQGTKADHLSVGRQFLERTAASQLGAVRLSLGLTALAGRWEAGSKPHSRLSAGQWERSNSHDRKRHGDTPARWLHAGSSSVEAEEGRATLRDVASGEAPTPSLVTPQECVISI